MILNFLIGAILFAAKPPGDSLQNFQMQLSRNIQLYMEPPPDYDSSGKCFYYAQLLKVEINNLSKVVSIDLCDGAPEWVKAELNKQKKRKNIDFKKLDSLASKARLRNCTLVFPFVVESEDFPCGQESKKRTITSKFFQFNSRRLKGNILFGEQIQFIWSVQYRYKLHQDEKPRDLKENEVR